MRTNGLVAFTLIIAAILIVIVSTSRPNVDESEPQEEEIAPRYEVAVEVVAPGFSIQADQFQFVVDSVPIEAEKGGDGSAKLGRRYTGSIELEAAHPVLGSTRKRALITSDTTVRLVYKPSSSITVDLDAGPGDRVRWIRVSSTENEARYLSERSHGGRRFDEAVDPVFNELWPGSYLVEVRTKRAVGRAEIEVEKNGDAVRTPVTLVDQLPGTLRDKIEGVVTLDGEVAENQEADWTCYYSDGLVGTSSFTTDSNGRYRLEVESLSVGSKLIFACAGYPEIEHRVSEGGDLQLGLPFAKDRGAPLLTVTDSEGNPVVGLEVLLEPKQRSRRKRTTNSAGQVALDGPAESPRSVGFWQFRYAEDVGFLEELRPLQISEGQEAKAVIGDGVCIRIEGAESKYFGAYCRAETQSRFRALGRVGRSFVVAGLPGRSAEIVVGRLGMPSEVGYVRVSTSGVTSIMVTKASEARDLEVLDERGRNIAGFEIEDVDFQSAEARDQSLSLSTLVRYSYLTTNRDQPGLVVHDSKTLPERELWFTSPQAGWARVNSRQLYQDGVVRLRFSGCARGQVESSSVIRSLTAFDRTGRRRRVAFDPDTGAYCVYVADLDEATIRIVGSRGATDASVEPGVQNLKY